MEAPSANHHHMLYERALWRKHHVYRALRQHRGLIIPMLVTDHRALHRALNQSPQSIREPSVPFPDLEAARHFVDHIALPHTPEEPLLVLNQAIGWFAMTDNFPTAEHLYDQREFILRAQEFGNDAA